MNYYEKDIYTITRKFLKHARLWHWWKLYIYECLKGERCCHFNKYTEHWYSQRDPSQVFGTSNFTDFLEDRGFEFFNALMIYEIFDTYYSKCQRGDSEEELKRYLNAMIVIRPH